MRRRTFMKLRKKQTMLPTVLRCASCLARIRKFDRYRIASVVHRSCGDPRMVGQQSFEVSA